MLLEKLLANRSNSIEICALDSAKMMSMLAEAKTAGDSDHLGDFSPIQFAVGLPKASIQLLFADNPGSVMDRLKKYLASVQIKLNDPNAYKDICENLRVLETVASGGAIPALETLRIHRSVIEQKLSNLLSSSFQGCEQGGKFHRDQVVAAVARCEQFSDLVEGAAKTTMVQFLGKIREAIDKNVVGTVAKSSCFSYTVSHVGQDAEQSQKIRTLLQKLRAQKPTVVIKQDPDVIRREFHISVKSGKPITTAMMTSVLEIPSADFGILSDGKKGKFLEDLAKAYELTPGKGPRNAIRLMMCRLVHDSDITSTKQNAKYLLTTVLRLCQDDIKKGYQERQEALAKNVACITSLLSYTYEGESRMANGTSLASHVKGLKDWWGYGTQVLSTLKSISNLESSNSSNGRTLHFWVVQAYGMFVRTGSHETTLKQAVRELGRLAFAHSRPLYDNCDLLTGDVVYHTARAHIAWALTIGGKGSQGSSVTGFGQSVRHAAKMALRQILDTTYGDKRLGSWVLSRSVKTVADKTDYLDNFRRNREAMANDTEDLILTGQSAVLEASSSKGFDTTGLIKGDLVRLTVSDLLEQAVSATTPTRRSEALMLLTSLLRKDGSLSNDSDSLKEIVVRRMTVLWEEIQYGSPESDLYRGCLAVFHAVGKHDGSPANLPEPATMKLAFGQVLQRYQAKTQSDCIAHQPNRDFRSTWTTLTRVRGDSDNDSPWHDRDSVHSDD